ncbi:hypothetical protein KBB96_18940 [Luteolibacter ambystomatis]|uniref:YIP1 family protein n=1 Tax=Luteolibacter ambystomatis TaxID=2824561 RepID=A0A975G7T4_9BACT|nr:hypothetical protein [Luteolibacter ambystomatis]QUE50922.1 hypothetical protein KBB96_18940 [Luteolibacter ambystomatis]
METPEIPPAPEPATPPPLDAPLPDKLDLRTLFEALLRRPYELVHRLAKPGHGATGRFAGIMLVSFLLFGVVIGCFHKHEQLWAAPLKITAGVAIAAAICFPSLYIFSTLAGGRLSVQQLAASFAGALALAGLLLLGFAPAVWIFAESTDSYGFVGALGIGAWLVALLFGLRFLKTAVFSTGANRKGPLVIWSGVFALVTLQMTTSLRPILGHSDKFLTQEKKFFLGHWGDWIGESQKPVTTTATPGTAESTPAKDAPTDASSHRNPFNGPAK